MSFKINLAKEKQETIYKTLYIKKELSEKIDKIAVENKTSWNNVVISMIKSCLED